MKKNKLFLLLSFLFFAGCANIQQQSDLAGIKSDVAQLQVKVESLANKQTDLYSKYENTMVANDTQSATVQELYKKISQLSQRIQDLETVNSKKSGEKVVLPSTLYQNAYNDFLMGKYDIALSGFKSFMKKYPEQDLSPQAQYYIGECLYSKEDYANAYDEYVKVEENYPVCDMIPASKLKMAVCLEKLGKQQDAMLVLQSIVLKYPNSPETFTAKEKIKVYTNGKSK